MTTQVKGSVIGAAHYFFSDIKSFFTTQLDRIRQFIRDAARPAREALI